MKPTKAWYALILIIPTIILAGACFSLGIIIWIVSLGHVNIFKYGFALMDLWSNLLYDGGKINGR